ncbi:MAG: hypothetical protein HF978_15780 [Desulfobacteraceae bacterium]|nr:hypothetical protein [Desulfobacteraceae bacterium]MBC2757003.1 hypothetical protein [Desulfobacteraceae bacterium]
MNQLSRLILALFFLLVGIYYPAVGQAQDDPLADCFWEIPKDLLFREVNYLYWRGEFTLPDNDQLVIHGQYPYSREFSTGLYIVTETGGRTEISMLPGSVVNPDEGSTNPCSHNASRYAEPRDYTVTVVHGSPPDPPEPNTLYLKKKDDGSFNNEGEILVRYYLPDQDTPIGGVALPEVFLLHPDGSTTDLTGTCPDPESTFTRENPDDWEQNILPFNVKVPVPGDATRPISWYAYLPGVMGGDIYVSQGNSYAYANIDVAAGEVLVIKGQAPTFPYTYESAARMGGGHVRYWSYSTYQWGTNRSSRGIFDEQIMVNPSQFYTIVLSRPEDRPSNADPECGVAWLDVNPSPEGTSSIVLRHVFPAPYFQFTPLNAGDWFGLEDAMGPYMPTGTYMSTEEFEDLGYIRR